MGSFWQKPLFLILCFFVLLVSIPISFFYLSKHPFFSSPKPTNISQYTVSMITRPGSCLLLEEKFCSQGQLINTKNELGGPEMYIGFRLPPDTPIFAERDGQVGKGQINQPSAFKGYQVLLRDPNLSNPSAISVDIKGDLRFENMHSVDVNKGDIIAYTQDTGIKNLGDYNLLITIRRRSPQTKLPASDQETIKKLFQLK